MATSNLTIAELVQMTDWAVLNERPAQTIHEVSALGGSKINKPKVAYKFGEITGMKERVITAAEARIESNASTNTIDPESERMKMAVLVEDALDHLAYRADRVDFDRFPLHELNSLNCRLIELHRYLCNLASFYGPREEEEPDHDRQEVQPYQGLRATTIVVDELPSARWVSGDILLTYYENGKLKWSVKPPEQVYKHKALSAREVCMPRSGLGCVTPGTELNIPADATALQTAQAALEAPREAKPSSISEDTASIGAALKKLEDERRRNTELRYGSQSAENTDT